MIAKLSRKAASKLCSSGAIGEADQALYEYALNILLSGFLHFGTSVALGAAFGIIPASLALFIPFIIIRKFAGGFHASTPLRCYLFSVATNTLLLAVVKWVSLSNVWLYYVLLLLPLVAIVLLAPADTKEKPLSAKEKRVFKLISIALYFVLATVSAVTYHLWTRQIGFAICLGLNLEGAVLGMALASRIRNRKSAPIERSRAATSE